MTETSTTTTHADVVVTTAYGAVFILEGARLNELPMPLKVGHDRHGVVELEVALKHIAAWAVWLDATIETNVDGHDLRHDLRATKYEQRVHVTAVEPFGAVV